MVLTKSQILNGINETKERYIKSKNDTVALRPLSNGEWNKIEEIQNEAIGEYTTTEKAKQASRRQRVQSQMEAQGKINVKETSKAEAKAKIEAVFLSLDNDVYKDDKFTREDVKNMGRDVFNEIYEQVRIISGLEDDIEKDVKDFPEDE
ncbi:MAG: hypothetical protein IJI42_09200 [Methanobrevibacter sp.]|nr:hypothetical protein [Methanobrevibacter sp.]